MQRLLNNYVQVEQLTTEEGVRHYIAPSTWGNRAGMVGALTLAKAALDGPKSQRSGWADRIQPLTALLAVAAAAVVVLKLR